MDQSIFSPRMGLPRTPKTPKAIKRHKHTKPTAPLHKVGDLTGNLSHFVEIRPFDLRRPDTLNPSRQYRERGGKLTLFIILLKVHSWATFKHKEESDIIF